MRMVGKTAVVFGGSGAIGAAVGKVLAREGAAVHLVARGKARLERVADAIMAAGGQVGVIEADVLDTKGLAAALAKLGHIDTVVNATSFPHDQGTKLDALTPEAFAGGFTPFLMADYSIAQAVTPQMGGARGGVIVTVVAPAAGMSMPGHLGHIVGCAGMEAFSRALASELAPRNIRVLCLRSHAIPEAVSEGSYTGELFAPKAKAAGLSVEEWMQGAAGGTMLKRLPTLSQVAETIAFLASDHAGAMTATVMNLTAGAVTN